jgi:hypothetical protein
MSKSPNLPLKNGGINKESIAKNARGQTIIGNGISGNMSAKIAGSGQL